MSDVAPVHGTALVLADRGVLIRGPSGSGKTALALELLAKANAAGLYAALVCDDQVLVYARGSRLVGRAAVAIAGLVEVRGLTPRPVSWTDAAVIDLLVDLVDRSEAPRYREPEPRALLGIDVDSLDLPQRHRAANAEAVFFRLELPPFCAGRRAMRQ
jgi:serine kinase of HPr protein (carbohydrate metabolism regulator)